MTHPSNLDIHQKISHLNDQMLQLEAKLDAMLNKLDSIEQLTVQFKTDIEDEINDTTKNRKT
jgi:hypothetical protein